MRQTNFQEFFSNFPYFSGKSCEEPLTNDADSPIPLYSHINVFSRKSLKASLFADKLLIHNDLQNDTSKYVYKEVS